MAINKRVAAAMKKVAKPKRKKTWADSQSAPQSKVYKPANDKAVLAKPVGFRWTDLGAARLGKNASVKPSAADIEKYKGKTFTKSGSKHSYLYSEKRADKTDVKKSEKFKAGGRTKKTWADSQNPPQSTVYKAANDKEVVAKPVGFRWTGYGAAKLGVNVMSKPSAADIEKYKNKTFKLRGENVRYLYSEKRADKSDVKRKDKFADGGMMARGGFVTNLEEAFKSDRLEAELKSKMKEGDAIVAFAYSDYGGDFFDKVAIEYFKENHPDNIVYEKSAYSGQNGIVFGEPAEEFLEATNNYLLGYEDIEDFYYQMENEQTEEDFKYFLDDLKRDGYKVSDNAYIYLMSEKSGYYSMQPNQLDFSYSDLTDELLKKGLIEKEMADGGMMAKGGVVGQYELIPYVSYGKMRSGNMSEFSTPSYKDTVIFEGSKDEAIMKANSMVDNSDEILLVEVSKVNPKATNALNRTKKIEMVRGNKMADGGRTKDYSGNYYSTYDFVGTNKLEKEADSLFGKNWEAEDDANQILELTNSLGGGYKVKVADDDDDWQYLRYKHDVNHATNDSNYDIFVFHGGRKRKMEDGGEFKRGGTFGGRQYDPYNEPADKARHAKPIGWRFTDAKAKRLKESPYEKPTAEQIEKYKGKGVYFENRQDKSDKTYSRKLADGGSLDYKREVLNQYSDEKLARIYSQMNDLDYSDVLIELKGNPLERKDIVNEIFKEIVRRDNEQMADGGMMADGGEFKRGGTFGGRQYDPYNEPADKARHAKPIGWRFTDAKAKRLKESPYEKPTAEQIEKYKGKGVYFENRQDKSDKTYSRKLSDGGLADNEVLRVKYISVNVHEDSYEGGEGKYVTGYTMPEFVGAKFEGNNIKGFLLNYLSNILYLSSNPNDYVIIDDCIHYDQLQDEDGSEASEYDKEQWREGKKVLYNAHYTICLGAVTERSLTDGELSAITGIGVYRSGGAVQSGVQSENYSEERDKLVVAKPVGWRFTNKFAKRKGFDAYRKPTAEEIEKYKGSGKVYYEVRFDKSDKNVRRRFEDGGMMEDGGMYSHGGKIGDLKNMVKERYGKGGMYEENFSPEPTNEEVDKAVRMFLDWTDAKQKKWNVKDIKNVEIVGDIMLYNRGEAFYNLGNEQEVKEVLKSVKRGSYADGGMMADGGIMEDDSYARGGVPKISNVESRSYTENMLPFKAANLEAKTLDNGDYVVLSYGYYPIWFYSKATNKWYGNKDKYSQTTAKQISQSRPTYDATILSKSELDEVMFSSSLGKLHDEERIVEANV